VLKPDYIQAALEKPTHPEASLQLLLFVDERPSSRKQIQQIQTYLENLKTEVPFELQMVEVGEQPYLAEHFKLVATPALIKIHPEPRQTLAGSNLIAQLKNCWPRWQLCAEEYQETLAREKADSPTSATENSAIRSVAHSAELIQLSDEIFRLKKEKEELLEQLQFKDRVLAMLAHDLRSPLTAASLAMETLELSLNSNNTNRPPKLTPALTQQLSKQARTQIRAMDRLIADILQAARGTSAQLHIQPHKLDLGALCHEVINSLKNRCLGKSQSLETDIPQDLPYVYADEERVRQVIVNLLDNAIKYTPEGGRIQVAMLHRTTQKIQVSVGDTGLGIPAENQERIFEDLYRLERDEAKEGYGIGLGLCQRIIRAHYGRIWVDSNLDKGSIFHFTLPVYR
jgi:two-component system clock-associated histidine kinase SasA